MKRQGPLLLDKPYVVEGESDCERPGLIHYLVL
jgi:hypothetical protein